ncbi:MAG TPA: hypothetical protein VKC65_05185 [Gaiellaceae bacterium]|nr:hypothetical protein [Gaiellaceae bacterium]
MNRWAEWERYAPLTGIAAVVLWVVGIIVLSGPGHLGNNSGDAAAVILAKYAGHSLAIQFGAWLVMLGALLFIWFVGSLRAAVTTVEQAPARLSTLVGMGGVATGFGILLAHAPSFAAATTSDNLTAPAAKALILMDDVFFYAAEFSMAVLFFATAVVIFRWSVLPGWLGWVSLVFAALAVIPPVGWAILALGLPLWTLVISWLLYAKQRGAPAGTTAASSTPVS